MFFQTRKKQEEVKIIRQCVKRWAINGVPGIKVVRLGKTNLNLNIWTGPLLPDPPKIG